MTRLRAVRGSLPKSETSLGRRRLDRPPHLSWFGMRLSRLAPRFKSNGNVSQTQSNHRSAAWATNARPATRDRGWPPAQRAGTHKTRQDRYASIRSDPIRSNQSMPEIKSMISHMISLMIEQASARVFTTAFAGQPSFAMAQPTASFRPLASALRRSAASYARLVGAHEKNARQCNSGRRVARRFG